ncbi:uracil nucleotide/cysteinyl leukotriene receptor-like [Elgaria multicarinata webbii]|uniref:uracil nucleotide/cysteinyl leukotriene receptor-like n=1 Tax=Elgaria multicarinata webbii TaxID=159646 RepID=UPI002FCD1919
MGGNGTHASGETPSSHPNRSAPLQCAAEAQFQHLLLPITYSLVCALSLASNGVALWSCWASRAQAPPVMIFIYNLMVIDLLFALSLPLQAVYHARRNDWPFGEGLCKATNALFLANMFSCTLFLACICLERYLAVIHPVRYLRLRWPLYRVLLSMAIWSLVGIGLLIFFSRSTVTRRFPNGNTACMENFPAQVWTGGLAAVVLVSSALGFFVPFFTIVICSVVIARRIMSLAHGSAQASSLRRHSLYTLLMVTGLLTLCFLPFHTIYTLHTLGRIGVLSVPRLLHFTCSAQRAAMALASINSALDPLVYYFNMKPANWKLPCCGTVSEVLMDSGEAASPTVEGLRSMAYGGIETLSAQGPNSIPGVAGADKYKKYTSIL